MDEPAIQAKYIELVPPVPSQLLSLADSIIVCRAEADGTRAFEGEAEAGEGQGRW